MVTRRRCFSSVPLLSGITECPQRSFPAFVAGPSITLAPELPVCLVIGKEQLSEARGAVHWKGSGEAGTEGIEISLGE